MKTATREKPIKVLSIQHPWAWFIVNGYKDIENRSWYTNYRGPVLIHAGKKFDEDGWEYIKKCFKDLATKEQKERFYGAGSITPRQIMETLGGIVGYAEITDCVKQSKSPWFFGEFGFVLKDARPLPFYPCRGQLGFFHSPLPEEYLRVELQRVGGEGV